MFPEVGATELVVIAAIALIVVGPKDLPILMRKVGQFLARMRAMAMEFRSSFDEMARQSELDELRREVEAMRQAAHQPIQTAAEAAGLHDVENDLRSGLVMDPIHTYQAETEPAAEAAAEPKPKRKRASRAKKAKGPEVVPEAQP